jgi:hypothetical protein
VNITTKQWHNHIFTHFQKWNLHDWKESPEENQLSDYENNLNDKIIKNDYDNHQLDKIVYG